jgi:6-pyruvoyltetrahydropterin/6-carboxytetrahydropterin synthase
MQIKRIFSFDSAHYLPNYCGKCHNMHGHTYTLEVQVQGDIDLDTGMVMDFGRLDEIVNRYVLKDNSELDLKGFDHCNLNIIIPNPTGELLIKEIAKRILNGLWEFDHDLKLTKLVLWESPKNEIIWLPEDGFQ